MCEPTKPHEISTLRKLIRQEPVCMLWAREGGINIRGVEQVVTCSILQVFVLSGFRKFQPSLGDNNLADGFAISLLFPPQTSPPCGPAPGCTRSRVWSAPAAAAPARACSRRPKLIAHRARPHQLKAARGRARRRCRRPAPLNLALQGCFPCART